MVAALLAAVNITSRHALKSYVENQLERIPWDLAMIQTILQLIVPHRLRGRVLSIWMLGWGLTPVGLLPLSAVAENFGTPVAMKIAGTFAVAIVVAIMLLMRSLWTLDAEAEGTLQAEPGI